LFAQRPVRSDYGRRSTSSPLLTPRRLLIIVGLLIVAVIAGILINTMGGSSGETPQEIPTIQAERPIKERPDQPGGIDIPHQDVAVFQQLDQKNGVPSPTGGAEQLLPPPETPQAAPAPATPPPVAEKAEVAPAATPSVQEALPPAVTEAAEPVPSAVAAAPEEPKKEEPKKEETKPVALKEPVKKDVQPTVKVKNNQDAVVKNEAPAARLPAALFTTGEVPSSAAPKKEAVTTPTPTTAPVAGKGASVQLASYPDEATAERELKRYQSKYAGILGGTSLRVVRADLGAKGVYYRLISGSVGEAKAKAICADLAKQKASCLVVR
jgi:hypothetical protein